MARRARHDLEAVQDKRAQVVELRAQGRTWDQIAAETGYSNGSAASKAWRAAIQQRPDLTVDEVRGQERARLEAMDSRLSEIIARPPIKTTSIGRTQFDVRTYTCTTKARTDQDHDPDCKVQPVLDETAVIAAIRERRMVGESLRKMVGADLGASGHLPIDQAREQAAASLAGIAAEVQEKNDQAAAWQQEQLDHFARREADLDARERAITAAITPQAGDDDIADAEVVNPDD